MTDRVERIASARAEAFEVLAATTGNASLCTLSRERLPAAKYHEGAVAALGDAMRAARAGCAPPAPDDWGSQWARLVERDRAWKAYVLGGREALARL